LSLYSQLRKAAYKEEFFPSNRSFRKLTLKPLADQANVIAGASSGIGLVTARMAARNEDAFQQLA
jgi:hypothetical protein